MNLSVVIGYPGAAGEGGRELRRWVCAPGLPLATHNIHRAASRSVGSIRALPDLFIFTCTLIQLRQKSLSCCTKVFFVSPIRPVHVGQCTDGEIACPEIGFPKTEKE